MEITGKKSKIKNNAGESPKNEWRLNSDSKNKIVKEKFWEWK